MVLGTVRAYDVKVEFVERAEGWVHRYTIGTIQSHRDLTLKGAREVLEAAGFTRADIKGILLAALEKCPGFH